MPQVVLGIDPGFASFGWCAMSIFAPAQLRPLAAGVIRTQKSSRKHAVYAADDNYSRCIMIARQLDKLCADYAPAALCAEAMSFPRSSSVAAKVAMAWGAVATIATLRGIPLMQASPQRVKLELCGVKDASKEQVQVAFSERVCPIDGLLGGLPRGQWEHPYDAAAVVVACLDHELMKMLVRA